MCRLGQTRAPHQTREPSLPNVPFIGQRARWACGGCICARPRPDLSSGCHLTQQVLHHHVRQHPQQHVTGLGVPVQPALGLGLRVGAAAFDHVGHQRPLMREGEEKQEAGQ